MNVHRIVVVTEKFPQETFIVRQVRGLDADVVSPYWESEGYSRLEKKPYLASLYKSDNTNLAVKAFRRMRQLIFGIPAPSWPAAMERIWDEYVRSRKPSVVLAEFAPNGMNVLEGCRRHKLPLVVHFHGYDASVLLRQPAYVGRLAELFDQASAIVTVSNKMRNIVMGLGCPIAKISVIPCGAPVGEFTVSERVSASHCRFIFIGRLIPVKGPILLLQAFQRCLQLAPNVSLCMIGDGPLRKNVARFIRRHRLGEIVQLLGRVYEERIRHELSRSSVLVQSSITTSRGQYEGGGPPVSVAEGAASGLPCIAFDSGGLPDFIEDGLNGFLIPEGDWKAMAERMAYLAGDPALRQRIGERNRQAAILKANSLVQIEKLRQVLVKTVRFKTDIVVDK